MARAPYVPQPESELEFFDLSIDPLSILGFDGEFKRVSESFVRLLGYTKPAREALAQLAEGRDVVGFEARVICADGDVRWLEWSMRSNARAWPRVLRSTGHNRAPRPKKRGPRASGAPLV